MNTPPDHANLVTTYSRWAANRTYRHKTAEGFQWEISLWTLKTTANVTFVRLLSQEKWIKSMVKSCKIKQSVSVTTPHHPNTKYCPKLKPKQQHIWKKKRSFQIQNNSNYLHQNKEENIQPLSLYLCLQTSEHSPSWRPFLETFFSLVLYLSWTKIPE